MYTGFGDGIDGHVTISFQVTPANENNTKWAMSCLPKLFKTKPALAYLIPFVRVSLKLAW